MRSPSSEEFCLFKSEWDISNWDLLDKGHIKFIVCKDCGVWTSEIWNYKEQIYIDRWVCKPFWFDMGARVRVIIHGEHFGMIGIVERRMRKVKALSPPPAPENYYYILFEKDPVREEFDENNLEHVI
jgi:hypothetical protein